MERECGVSAFTGKATIYTAFDDEVELHLLVELLMRPGK
jgi:hypothetical protein